MRVLLISHTSQSRTEGQPKAHFLGRMPGVELRVLVPRRWKHYGRWRQPEPPLEAAQLVAHGGLAQAQLFCGARGAARACDGLHQPQISRFQRAVVHLMSKRDDLYEINSLFS